MDRVHVFCLQRVVAFPHPGELVIRTADGQAVIPHGQDLVILADDTLEHGPIECLFTIDEETGLTSREGVYAGGDAVTGAATVILAMGAGKTAAKAMDEYMQSKANA